MLEKNQNPYLIPGSIIIAGVFVAVALYLSGGGISNNNNNNAGTANRDDTNIGRINPDPGSQDINMQPVSEDDYIKGSFDAPVKIVEFSDTECPFCKKIHSTLQQIVDDYDGQVAWIYRHAPLAQLHTKAQREAEAIECAGELGGNDGFWAYLDRLFEITPSNDGLLDSQLPEIAEFVGINRSAFLSCLDSGKYTDKVKSQLEDAFAAGLSGTPYSVVVAPNGELFPVSGAQPYASIKAIVDLALKSK